MSYRLEIPDLGDLIKRYRSGVPLQRISKESGYGRAVLARRFVEAGVEIRSYSDGQRSRWRHASKEDVQRWLGKAWEASRGRVDTPAAKASRARSKFLNQSPGPWGKEEHKIATFLELAEFPVVQQRPAGPYNVDISFEGFPVAIEIVHGVSSEFNAAGCGTVRLKKFLDRDWFVLYLIATGSHEGRSINLRVVGHDLLAWADLACRDEALRGHYWVIWGHGDPPPKAKYDFGENPIVPPTLRPNKVALHKDA